MKKFRFIQIRWKEPLGHSHCFYAYRWVLNLGLFSFRIHHFLRSDDKRFFHDHSWWFLTFVIKGSYTDVSPYGEDVLKAGNVRFRKANHPHYVKVAEGGVWTFLITGPMVRKWGFWVNGKFKRPLKYFAKFGHPPCSEQ